MLHYEIQFHLLLYPACSLLPTCSQWWVSRVKFIVLFTCSWTANTVAVVDKCFQHHTKPEHLWTATGWIELAAESAPGLAGKVHDVKG